MKKILAFTLALAMVLATWTPTFAASKEVEALANLKLLLNTTDKEVNADLTRAVGLAMVLKALGYTQEDANAKAKDNTFVDMDKAAWAKGFAVLGEEMKITNGTSVEPKKFSPNWELNERAFVAFMLRALGYDVDAAWAKAGELAKEAMIAETVSENKLTKGEAAVIMYKALKAKVQGDEKGRTLAEKLVDEKKLDKELAVANELIAAEPENLEVVSATADNLKEIVVKFNGTVDKESAEKPGNYRLKSGSVDKAEVKDGVVVLKVKNNLVNKKEYELNVLGVKNVDKKEMKKQTVMFTAVDSEIPSITDVVVTGPKNLTIKFSEPINVQAATDIKVVLKAGTSTFAAKLDTTVPAAARELDFSLFNTLREDKEYTLMIGDAKNNSNYPTDFAGYKALYYEQPLTYVKDTTAPEVKVVKAGQKEVVIEFTKPVKGLATGVDNVYHSFASYKPVAIKDGEGKNLTDKNKAYDKFTLVFHDGTANSRALIGNVVLTILGEANKNKIEDNWGNKLADTNLDLTVTADLERPTVTSVEPQADGQKVKVTFNEGLAKSNVSAVLVDEKGKEAAKDAQQPAEAGKKELTFDFKKSFVGKTFTLVVKDAKDNSLNENKMLDHSEEITFSDKSLMSLTDAPVSYLAGANPFLYITFPEEMSDSALDLANYRLTGDYTLKGFAQFLEGNRKTLAIELTEDDVAKITVDTTKVTFSPALTDLAGNAKNQFDAVYTSTIKAFVNSFKANKATATSRDRIVVEFSEDIKAYEGISLTNGNPAENINYVVAKAGSKYRVVNVNKIDDKKLELTIDSETLLPVDTDTITVTVKENTVESIFNSKFAAAQTENLVDKIAPAYETVKYETNGAATTAGIYTTLKTNIKEFDGRKAIKIDERTYGGYDANSEKIHTAKVTIKFQEKISGSSLSRLTFAVNKGWSVKVETTTPMAPAAGASAVEVSFTIEKKGHFKTEKEMQDELKELTVIQGQDLTDVHGNVLRASSEAMSTVYVGE